jgi:hypothetical protein
VEQQLQQHTAVLYIYSRGTAAIANICTSKVGEPLEQHTCEHVQVWEQKYTAAYSISSRK